MPVEPREFLLAPPSSFCSGVAHVLDVPIKVVRARTLAHRDRQGRLSYLESIQGHAFQVND
jgi:hypothetical protein